MSIYRGSQCYTTGYYYAVFIPYGPSNPRPMPHISELFKLVIREWWPVVRWYWSRAQPRWKRGRWKAKT